MRILRANHLGMCFGVRDAISLAERMAKDKPLTILGDLVHNETVLASLREKNIAIVDGPESARTRTAMITAHGASDRAIQRAREHGLHIVEATCPLVRVAHRAVQKLVAEGYHPVIIGKPGHVEVRGLTEDLQEHDVILEDGDVSELPVRPRFGVACQTTQPMERVERLVGLMRLRFPASEIRFIDTVCQPTKLRQEAAIDLARRSDIVIVIGGAASNNTRELVETCRKHCARVYLAHGEADIDPAWFREEDTVGITAGTSTPDVTIRQVENAVFQLLKQEQALAPMS